jgi:hypothetical protein
MKKAATMFEQEWTLVVFLFCVLIAAVMFHSCDFQIAKAAYKEFPVTEKKGGFANVLGSRYMRNQSIFDYIYGNNAHSPAVEASRPAKPPGNIKSDLGECWPVWTEESKLNLGRCLHAEAQTHRADWAPMAWRLTNLWVTTRRTQGWTINEQIKRYCGMFKNKGKRPAAIRASTWDNPVHGKQREWDTIHTFVEDFTAGNIEDPLPLADHWAGPNDPARPNWEEISRPPLTANIFYRSY